MNSWDADGDAVFLCHDPLLIDTKIDKTIIIDVDDKISAKKQKYTKEAIIDYEMNSRDNRIGEITHSATGFENQYTKDPKWIKINNDNVSLLRVYQGKEIDAVKTGVRWHLTKSLRKPLKKLPYFLLYHYPDRLAHYIKLKRKNEKLDDKDKLPLNAFHSPSPLNEMCDFVETWEKQHILWDGSCCNTQSLVINNSLNLNDISVIRKIKHINNCFVKEWKYILTVKDTGDIGIDRDVLLVKYHELLQQIIPDDEILLANYVIKTCYITNQTNKHLAWYLYHNIILENLRENSPSRKQTQIIETDASTPGAREYLGKYYLMIEGDQELG